MYSDYADDVRTISLCTMKAVSGRSPAVARVELYITFKGFRYCAQYVRLQSIFLFYKNSVTSDKH